MNRIRRLAAILAGLAGVLLASGLIAGAYATMECQVRARYPAGDRMLYVGEVLTMQLKAETELWGPVIKAAGITSNE